MKMTLKNRKAKIKAEAAKLRHSSGRFGDHGFTGAGLYVWHRQRDVLLYALKDIEVRGEVSFAHAESAINMMCPQAIEEHEGRTAGTTAGKNWVRRACDVIIEARSIATSIAINEGREIEI